MLGCILLNPEEALPVCVTRLGDKSEAFYDLKNREIYATLVRMFDVHQAIDLITLSDMLMFQGQLEQVGGTAYLAELPDATPSAANLSYYLDILLDHYRQRQLIQICTTGVGDTYEGGTDVAVLIDRTSQQLFDLASDQVVEEEEPMTALIHQAISDIELMADSHGAISGVASGFPDLDKLTTGFHGGELILVAARPSMGKAQPFGSLVLTPTGFVPIEQLMVGEYVIGKDGKPTRVLGVFPQGDKEIFKVSFSDDTAAWCCDEHLWFTQTRNERRRGSKGSVKTLAQIRQTLHREDGGNRNHVIPLCSPVEFEPCGDRPLDAWLLGALLGDGKLKNGNVMFSKPELDVQQKVLSKLPQCDMGLVNGMDIRIKRKQRSSAPSETKAILFRFGLSVESEGKFIPSAYLHASPTERLDLLRGLLDTDGYVLGHSVEFSTSSPQLAFDMAFLVRSLGGICSVANPRFPQFTYKGEKKTGLLSFRMNIWFNDGTVPVASEKQLSKFRPVTRYIQRSIVGIESNGIKPCVCIMVNTPDGLYITDDFIVTHNTSLAMNIAEHVAIDQHLPVGVFSLEMTRLSLVLRMLCSMARVNLRNVRDGFLAERDYPKLTNAAGRLNHAPLFINDRSGLSIMGLRTRARRMHRAHGIKLLIVDYLQLLSAERNRNDSRQNEVTMISGGLKALAKELDIPVIALSQLNRKLEDDKNRKPRLADLRESGSLEQDADVVCLLYHPKNGGDEEDQHSDACPVNLYIAKQRNGPTADVPLIFLKGLTRFESAAKVSAEDAPPPEEQSNLPV